jgi:hypothetical protein
MTKHEEELRRELRETRDHLIKAIELSRHYGINWQLTQAFTPIENAYVWFVQEHQ